MEKEIKVSFGEYHNTSQRQLKNPLNSTWNLNTRLSDKKITILLSTSQQSLISTGCFKKSWTAITTSNSFLPHCPPVLLHYIWIEFAGQIDKILQTMGSVDSFYYILLCHMNSELRTLSYELRSSKYQLWAKDTSYELQTSHKIWDLSYELRDTRNKVAAADNSSIHHRPYYECTWRPAPYIDRLIIRHLHQLMTVQYGYHRTSSADAGAIFKLKPQGRHFLEKSDNVQPASMQLL